MSSGSNYTLNGEIEESDEENDKIKHKFRSKAWDYFRIVSEDAKVASCKLCSTHFSYKSTSGNLRIHLEKRHKLCLDGDANAETQELQEPGEDEKQVEDHTVDMTSRTWRYFDIIDSVNKLASCRLCQLQLSYRSALTNLTKHVKHKHTPKYYGTDGTGEEFNKPRRVNASPTWKFFRKLDRKLKIAMCLLCSQTFSYNTTIGNLNKHLERKHPGVDLHEDFLIKNKTGDEVHKIDLDNLKADNSQLQDDPMEMEEIYLEDIEDHIVPKDKGKKRRYSSYSRAAEPEYEIIDEVRQTKADSIDHFGTYVTSLLRQLPKSVSSKLQADFVKQIMDAQITLESAATEKSNDNYAIIIRRDESAEPVENTIEHAEK